MRQHQILLLFVLGVVLFLGAGESCSAQEKAAETGVAAEPAVPTAPLPPAADATTAASANEEVKAEATVETKTEAPAIPNKIFVSGESSKSQTTGTQVGSVAIAPAEAEASAALAEPAEPEAKEEKIAGGMQGFISLNLRNIDINEALKYLSSKAGLNIVTTKNVAGRVTLMVEHVPVKDVFDIMLRSGRLAYDTRGQIYNVMTEDEYKVLYGKPFFDTREVKTLSLNYTIPEQAFSLLDALKSEIGRILVDAESGRVLIIDIPDKIRQMLAALEDFEKKNEVRVFPLQYARARDVEDQLRSQLELKKVGLIMADERSNQVMVQTLPERMKSIEQMIRKLDAKTKEVIIETNIVKVKLIDSGSQGIQWEGLFGLAQTNNGLIYAGSTPFAAVNPASTAGSFTSRQDALQSVGYVGSYPFSGTSASLNASTPAVGSEKLHIGLINAQDADILLTYIKNIGTTKILANPKLVVTNNQESRIHVGEKQAYVTTTTTSGTSTNTVAENVNFVDIGIQLSITPVINDDGYVTMKVKTEISSVTSTLTTPTQNKIPIIDTSLAETTVMVKEGITIVIGGLRQETKIKNVKQTPLLGSLPFVGNVFKTTTNSLDRTELIIMLTPKIITGDVLEKGYGRKPESFAIKDRQTYNDFKSKDPGVGGSVYAVGPPPAGADKKIGFKGMRVAE